MCKQYAYARISRKSQNIDRQIENIKRAYPDARIFQEAYTGTKIEGRKEFNKMLSFAKEGDILIFDSVSRMSRDTNEGVQLYFELFDKGINLVFLKESYINTEVYSNTIKQTIEMTGNDVTDIYIDATNRVIKLLARQQVYKAFEQSEKEVTDLHERTKEGIREAKRKGKQIGRAEGTIVVTRKSIEVKKLIKQYCKDFDGSLNDIDTIVQIKGKLGSLSKNTYYKYKREMFEELAQE